MVALQRQAAQFITRRSACACSGHGESFMKFLKYFAAAAAVMALSGCLGGGDDAPVSAPAPAPAPAPLQLQILSINDFEGRLEPVTVEGGRAAGGAAVLASYLNEWERRATARGASTIRVQAGDAIGPTPPISGLLQDEPTMMIMDSLRIAFGLSLIHI